MRKIIMTLASIIIVTSGAFAQNYYRGEKGVSSVGGIVGYAVDNESMLIGLDYRYNIGHRVRFAPSFLHVFKNKNNINESYFNIDTHYLERVTETFTLYPLLGISVMNKTSPINITTADTTTTTVNDLHIGLNFGFGCETRVNRDIIIGLEFKYHLTENRRYNQALFVARMAYYF